MADFRALCAELVDAIDSGISTDRMYLSPVMLRTRSALAQPKPQRPSVMDIIALADEVEEEGLGQVDLVRRALARWGHHTSDHLLGAEGPTNLV
jgi:hypothetical protein